MATTDKRAALVAGLRELADFIESRPELPLAPHDTVIGFRTGANWAPLDEAEQIGRVRQWAEILDVEVDTSVNAATGKTHWRADRAFGPVNIGISAITETAAEASEPS